MDFSKLTTGRFDSVKPSAESTEKVSTGNQQPAPHNPPYKKGEADISRMEQQEVYLAYGRKHAEKFGVKIVLSLQAALDARRQKLAVLTIREADILARQNVPLNSTFLSHALTAIDGVVSEGIPGEKDNAYFLRETYNRGINFKKQYYHTVNQERKDKADAALKEILEKLDNMNLPAWPEELDNGFAVELCKPEYMNWEQYRQAASNYISRDPETLEVSHDINGTEESHKASA